MIMAGVYRTDGWMDKWGIGIDCNGVIARHSGKLKRTEFISDAFPSSMYFDKADIQWEISSVSVALFWFGFALWSLSKFSKRRKSSFVSFLASLFF